MTRPGLASNGLQADPDAMYHDPVPDEGMYTANTRLVQLRRRGFSIVKTCAERPSDIICPPGHCAMSVFQAWGITLERPSGTSRDLFFRIADYPDGWQKADNNDPDSAIRYHILDDQGRIRITSRRTHARRDGGIELIIHTRFSSRARQIMGFVRGEVYDANSPTKPLFSHTTPLRTTIDRKERFAIAKRAQEKAECWLNEHFPNWHDPSAYWDD